MKQKSCIIQLYIKTDYSGKIFMKVTQDYWSSLDADAILNETRSARSMSTSICKIHTNVCNNRLSVLRKYYGYINFIPIYIQYTPS